MAHKPTRVEAWEILLDRKVIEKGTALMEVSL
jgi:hypothetical protein